jgi:hypothetical protein
MRLWRPTRALVFRPIALGALWLFFTLFGCASATNQIALQAEHALEAGSTALDLVVDDAIENCRHKQLATEAERAACIGPTEALADRTDEAMAAIVVGLRLYWISVAAGDKDGARDALSELVELVRGLPPEFFRGVQGLLGRMR